MQSAQELRDGEASRHKTNKRHPNRAGRKLSKATLVHAVPLKGLIGWHVLIRNTGFGDLLCPDVSRRARCWKGMDAKAAKRLRSATQACFDHEPESGLVQRGASKSIVYAAKRDAWLHFMPLSPCAETALLEHGAEPALLQPCRNHPRLHHPHVFLAGEYRSAVVRWCKAIEVLEDNVQ